MSFGGHVLDMIKKMKQHRKMRSHQSKFKSEDGTDLNFGMTFNPEFGKDGSQEVIDANQLSLQRELRKRLIINVITIISIIIGMWYLFA
jgi:hypothetical protein